MDYFNFQIEYDKLYGDCRLGPIPIPIFKFIKKLYTF